MLRAFIFSFSLFFALCTAVAVSAQSWSSSGDRATAPGSMSGDHAGGFEIICSQGEWTMYVFTGHSPESEASPVTITVDGQPFQTRHGLFGAGDQGIALTSPIIAALKSGNKVEVSYPTGGTPFSATFGLRGSSRALESVAANCSYPTPASDPERFKSAAAGSSSEAITQASMLLRPVLDEAHQIDPRVGIATASFVDLDNGWRFLISDIGPSTTLYGVAAFETVISAKPPSSDWRIVEAKTGVATYIDAQSSTNNYPDIMYQSVRGVNPPFNLWTWDGQNYVHTKTIQP